MMPSELTISAQKLNISLKTHFFGIKIMRIFPMKVHDGFSKHQREGTIFLKNHGPLKKNLLIFNVFKPLTAVDFLKSPSI